jgi:hypothetical protein
MGSVNLHISEATAGIKGLKSHAPEQRLSVVAGRTTDSGRYGELVGHGRNVDWRPVVTVPLLAKVHDRHPLRRQLSLCLALRLAPNNVRMGSPACHRQRAFPTLYCFWGTCSVKSLEVGSCKDISVAAKFINEKENDVG